MGITERKDERNESLLTLAHYHRVDPPPLDPLKVVGYQSLQVENI